MVDPVEQRVDLATTSPTCSKTTVLEVLDFDFTTMHNLLYYLYTGKVNMHMFDIHNEPAGYLPKVDAFELYKAADMYMIDALSSRCLSYLRESCTLENICQRLFDPECDVFPAVREMFLEFMVENFPKISQEKDWEDVLTSDEVMDGPQDSAAVKYSD